MKDECYNANGIVLMVGIIQYFRGIVVKLWSSKKSKIALWSVL